MVNSCSLCCFSRDFDSCDRQLAAALAAVYVASAVIFDSCDRQLAAALAAVYVASAVILITVTGS
jgi:hypothetical protein